MTSLFPLIILAVVVVISLGLRGKLAAKTAALHGDALDQVRALLAPRAADESSPLIVVGTERKRLSATVYYVGVTSHRLALYQPGGETQVVDRRAVRMSMKPKTWADIGNMQTIHSSGWELVLQLGDRSHTLRVYELATAAYPDHPAQIRALAATLAAA